MKKQTVLMLLIISILCGTMLPAGGLFANTTKKAFARLSARSFYKTYSTEDIAAGSDNYANSFFESANSNMQLNSDEQPLTATRISKNTDTDFLHIDDITAFVGSSGVYFSDGANLYKNSDLVQSNNAVGITFYQGKVITSRSGGIYYKDAPIANGSFGAITVFGDRLFAASGNNVVVFSVDYTATTDSFTLASIGAPLTFTAGVAQLASSSEAVYVKVDGQNIIRKIYQTDDEFVSGEVRPSVSNLKSIAANPASPLLFCLTNNYVTIYTDEQGGVLSSSKTIPNGGATHLAVGENKIYLAYYDDGCYNISEAAHALTNQKTIIAGRSDADYFYNSPLGISSRFGELFVADAGNNRISRLSSSGITHLTKYTENGAEIYFDQPSSATLSLEGELFVAHKNKLTLTKTGKTLTLKDPSGNNLIAEKILQSSSGNIYVLAVQPISGASYAFSADSALNSLSILDFTNPSAIGHKAGGEVLFFQPDDGGRSRTSGAIKNLNGDTVLQCGYLKDFVVDYASAVFGLGAQGEFVSVREDKMTNHGGNYDKIALSNVSNTLCGYGDVLLVETNTNSLKKISAAAAGVADISDHFTVPDVENDFSAHAKTSGFVASVRYDAPIFAQPSEATVAHTAPKGSDVFIRYDIATPEDMYFVLTEDEDGQALRFGYIYRSALNAPYAYVMPTKNTARVIIDIGANGFIYKYPSLFSNTVAVVAKGDVIKLLTFAANRYNDTDSSDGWFEGAGGHTWVRVDYGEGEGYILKDGLSWSLFSSDTPQPNTNATIVENAPLYVYNSATKKYEFLDGSSFLAKGKRVEVKTPFDSSSKYTQVIFSVETEGTVEVIDITVFVETKCIDYDGVDILQIVAICALIIALILLICLSVWFIRKRRRRVYDMD